MQNPKKKLSWKRNKLNKSRSFNGLDRLNFRDAYTHPEKDSIKIFTSKRKSLTSRSIISVWEANKKPVW